ncbi:MAG: SGNH/GDSL hydrolase family protein [Cyanobacteria bacterium J06592_8]
MNKLKTWVINFSLVLGSIATAFGLTELGLRMALIPGYQNVTEAVNWAPTEFHTTDRDRAWALKPGASGWWRSEGETYIKINSQGWRDVEYSKAKPSDQIRIAVLGDSFTEAFQVPLEQTFLAVIERQLKSCESLQEKTVKTLNFGVQGYSTAQELMTLQTQVWKYNPDWVILAFYTGNDIINNSPKLEYDRYRPFFRLENQELVLDNSFRQLNIFERNPYAVSKVDQFFGEWGNGSRILYLVRKIELESKKRQLGKDFVKLRGKSFKEPGDKVWKEAWEITEKLILKMAAEVKQNQAKFMVVTLSDPKQVDYDPAKRQAFKDRHNITNLFYPDQRIQTLGENNNIPVISLVEPFQNYAEKHQTCLHGFENAAACGGHWNSKGHQLAGELIADQFCKQVQENG